MRAKVEKTANGKVKAVTLKKRKVSYGVVEMHDKFESGKKTHELPADENPEAVATHKGGEESESSGGHSGSAEQAEKAEATFEAGTEKSMTDAMEMLLEMMKEEVKRAEEREDRDKEWEKEREKQESKSESEKQEEKKEKEEKEREERSKKNRDELLTEYLVTQLRLRALSEILGAVKVAEEGKHYYSYIVVEGETMSVFRTSPAKGGLILDFNTFPFFESEAKAQAFLELCYPIINRFCRVMSMLNPIAVVSKGDIEVIHS